MKIYQSIIIIATVLMILACNNQPKTIEPIDSSDDVKKSNSTGIFNDSQESQVLSSPTESPSEMDQFHKVKALELLPTQKYVYILVEEKDKTYWIATGKMEVEIGDYYFYRDGIFKSNFHSKEHNRTFDEVYLVSRLVPVNHAGEQNTISQKSQQKRSTASSQIISNEGSTSIASIVANPEKYEGQTIKVSGICTKLNANIMGRNWIHLKDGTQDDYDFVVTSDVVIPEGHKVSFSGQIALNRDFGAGYKYEILMEDAQLDNSKP